MQPTNKPSRVKPAQIELAKKIQKLREEGLAYKMIGYRLGMNPNTVAQILRRYRVRMLQPPTVS